MYVRSAPFNDEWLLFISATVRDTSRTLPGKPLTGQDQTAEECSDPVLFFNTRMYICTYGML